MISAKRELFPSTIRKYLFVQLLFAENKNLTSHNIVQRVQSSFNTLAILVNNENRGFGGYNIHIGILNTDASKHNFKQKRKKIFPEFAENHIHIQSHKGWGIVCIRMTEGQNNIFVWGDQSEKDIFELARASRQHKKLQLVQGPMGFRGKPSEGKVPLKKRSIRGSRRVFDIIIYCLLFQIVNICFAEFFPKDTFKSLLESIFIDIKSWVLNEVPSPPSISPSTSPSTTSPSTLEIILAVLGASLIIGSCFYLNRN